MIKANSTGVSEVCDSLPSLDPFWAQNSLSILIFSINSHHHKPNQILQTLFGGQFRAQCSLNDMLAVLIL